MKAGLRLGTQMTKKTKNLGSRDKTSNLGISLEHNQVQKKTNPPICEKEAKLARLAGGDGSRALLRALSRGEGRRLFSFSMRF